MSKKANPVFIGAFVVAALCVAVAAIMILGAGSLFSDTEPFVLYFDGSLAGLDEGAPVEYGGVRIGEVTDISFEYNTDDNSVLIPVYIEIERSRIKFSGVSKGKGKRLEYQIQQGLRGQIQSQSFVTGKLKIMLVMNPDSPIHLVGDAPSSIPEIPTTPSLLEHIGKSLSDLPLAEMVDNLNDATKMLATIANQGTIEDILTELKKTTTALANLIDSPDIKAASISLSETLAESKDAVANINQSIAPLRQELTLALNEFAEAARSARHLMNYLDRHPEALIRGKGGE
jgi:paraquat-inducible protein B